MIATLFMAIEDRWADYSIGHDFESAIMRINQIVTNVSQSVAV